MSSSYKQYFPGFILLGISFIITLFTLKDYGVSWDEPLQREVGLVSYNYIFNNDNSLLTYEGRDHGVAFELPLLFIEHAFKITDPTGIYIMRHLVTNLFFLFAGFCCYVLAYRLFKNNLIACLGFILFVFHPRMYAHSFYNTKDIPFQCSFVISLLAGQIAFEKNKIKWYVLLGVACGYATSIRMLGILLFACVVAFFIIDIITALVRKERYGPIILNLFGFVLGFIVTLYATFPSLWTSPIHNAIEVYQSLLHFKLWLGAVLLNGTMYYNDKIPQMYIPVWFCISIPLLFLLSGFAGVILIIIDFFRKPLSYITNTRDRNFALYVVCFIVPIVLVVVMRSVVYDDWRHLYFTYVPFVLLILYTFNKLYALISKSVVVMVYALQLIVLFIFIIRYYPYHNVYFNCLVSHGNESLRKNYDLDYWGVGSIEGLKYIAAHDTASMLKIAGKPPVGYNMYLLPPKDRARFVFVDQNNMDSTVNYFITNYRDHAADYEYPNVIYNKKVLNSSILTVYKLR